MTNTKDKNRRLFEVLDAFGKVCEYKVQLQMFNDNYPVAHFFVKDYSGNYRSIHLMFFIEDEDIIFDKKVQTFSKYLLMEEEINFNHYVLMKEKNDGIVEYVLYVNDKYFGTYGIENMEECMSHCLSFDKDGFIRMPEDWYKVGDIGYEEE